MSVRVTLDMDPQEARAVWHALGGIVDLIDQVDTIPPHAPLYGQRDRLIDVARRLDHECNQAGVPR